jgi:hypothetical protein
VADPMIVQEHQAVAYCRHAHRRICLVKETNVLDPLEQGASTGELQDNVKLAGGLECVEKVAQVLMPERFENLTRCNLLVSIISPNPRPISICSPQLHAVLL